MQNIEPLELYLDLPDNILPVSGHEIGLKGWLYFEHLGRVKWIFLLKKYENFFIFSCAFIVVKVKDVILWLRHIMEIRLVILERWYGPNFPMKYYK